MENNKPYTSRQRNRAVNLAALLGWLVITGPLLLSAPRMIFWVAIIGLPIAFLACWIVAAPVLTYVMRRPISWLRAATWGATISALMAFIYILASRLNGWRQSLNPNSWSQIGGGDKIRSIDGILTPYGWQALAQSAAIFILFGVVVAVIIRALIGRGNQTKNSSI